MSLRLPQTHPIDTMALTTELKRRVPSLEGISLVAGEIDLRRLSGEFTESERGELLLGVEAHDVAALRARARARLDEREEIARVASAERTLAQRIRYLELVHGMD